ncbi:MAG TPA: ABC-F type ribosomal protection protein [Candidatus Limiplasma sp.]|nr:ABC-F type ribosomal protection protein [Candidatus Limiplasma sp.]HRX08100.1 ABC-F type ribosomal protection protein [Candidatus Limiplasma sp.]
MALLQMNSISFAYEGSYDNVFDNLSFQADTDWHLGLIGRNGRGKTTLLRILSGELSAQGTIILPLRPALFPFAVPDPTQIAMDTMLSFAPLEPQWRVMAEAYPLGLTDELLSRPYATLSRGEQTKLQLAALFARDDSYPLIDEPTNHLDLEGREMVAEYLAKKRGFLLVSHDRHFLNRCITHTLSLNRSTVTVQRGDYDSWELDLRRKNEAEQARNEQLKKEIVTLQKSARRQADFANKAEKGKFNVHPSEVAAVDRGYVGARAAAMMKRSLATRARIKRDIQEKETLLKDTERIGLLKLKPLEHPKQRLIEVRDASVRYGERTVCDQLSFTVERGECIALAGPNGCGKSSVLKTICSLSNALQGSVSIASGLKISYVPQSTEHLHGELNHFIAQTSADETLFKAILRNMDFGRQQFDKDIAQYSEGQKKKLLLARSLCEKAHLFVWDEPLNYIDVYSRVQLEELLLAFQPTILLVEHDRAFLTRVATRIIHM